MTFYSVFVNLRKMCALDCCTITNLNEINHNCTMAWWIAECFSTSKDVGSSPVAFQLFFSSFFVFILDFVHNWIHLYEFGMRLCSKYSTVNNSISLHVVNSLHAEYLKTFVTCIIC